MNSIQSMACMGVTGNVNMAGDLNGDCEDSEFVQNSNQLLQVTGISSAVNTLTVI